MASPFGGQPAQPGGGGVFNFPAQAPAAGAANPFGATPATQAPGAGGFFGGGGGLGATAVKPAFGGLGGGFGGLGGGGFGGGGLGGPLGGGVLGGGAPGGAATNVFGLTKPSAGLGVPMGQQLAATASATTLLPQREVEALEAALDPAAQNSRYRFRALLHEMRPNPVERVKPAGVDELRWREALEEVGGERNAEHMWPVQAQGFDELFARYKKQKDVLEEQAASLEQAARALAARQRRRDASVAERVERVRERHAEQTHRLLRAARVAEGLDATHAPWAPEPLRQEELELRKRLAQLRAELAAGGGAHARQAEALRAAARARAAAQPQAARRPGAPGADTPAGAAETAYAQLDKESLSRLSSLLGSQTEALRTLAAVVKRDARDVAIIEKQAEQDGDAMRT